MSEWRQSLTLTKNVSRGLLTHQIFGKNSKKLTLILPTWIIWWAPNNANKWQMGFNSALKGLKSPLLTNYKQTDFRECLPLPVHNILSCSLLSTNTRLIYLGDAPVRSVGIATDYGLDGPGWYPGVDEIFRPSRPVLVPTQPPVKWVPSLSWG